jgi:hypothetical protein
MRCFLSFILGVILGAAGYWFFAQQKTEHVTAAAPVQNTSVTTSTNSSETSTQSVRGSFDSEKIKEELARTGRVIREKADAAGHAIADATANARITATIKTKLIRDSGLSAFKIDVSTTDGVVTLSGTVSSYDAISKAIQLALETDGVHQVISTIQVKPK